MEQKYIIALELSGSQVKGAVATVPAGAYGAPYPTVEAIAYEDKVDCVHYGRVQNLIDAANHVNFILQKLANDPKLGGGTITGAYVGIGGRSVGTIKKEGKVELGQEMEISEEVLRHVYADAIKTVPGDRQVLDVLPRRFYVDNQLMANPVGAIGSRVRGEFTIITCNPANLRNLEKLFSERVNLPVKKYIVTPLAVGRLVLGDEERTLGCILVDMGAQTTTVSIYKDRSLQYMATLPLGSANITRDIATGTNITDERAEAMKINQGNAMAEGSTVATDSARINCYVHARVGEIIANIMQQIEYAGYKPADLPAGYIITGRGTKLRNFDKSLESQSKMPVRRASIPGIVNVGLGDPNDFTSLVAIVDAASKGADLGSCVEMPRPAQPEQPTYDRSDVGTNYDEGDDDEGWDLDDDENERRKEEKVRKAKRELEKQERKRAQDAARARRREQQADVTDDLDDDAEEDDPQPKKRGLRGILDRIQRAMTLDPEEDDTPLD